MSRYIDKKRIFLHAGEDTSPAFLFVVFGDFDLSGREKCRVQNAELRVQNYGGKPPRRFSNFDLAV